MEVAVTPNDLQEVLTPFYKRASEAVVRQKLHNRLCINDRLARLEASLASQQASGNEELLKKANELQSKLDEAEVLQREKALKEVQQLASENAKLQYRITHLVQALKEADSKIASN